MNYDGMSTAELLRNGVTLFDVLERCARTRRRQDRASDTLTDLFLIVEALGQRLRVLEWNESVAVPDDEESDHEPEQRRDISLHELMTLTDEEDDVALDDDDVTALRQRVRELEAQRGQWFRGIIAYTTAGCSTAEQITKKWMALIRRVCPEMLELIGTSQTAVARALGERRATTSAREKREFEAPMKRAGARGWRGGTGGLRTEQNRANCSKAQRGNRNRAKGHAAQSPPASGHPEAASSQKKHPQPKHP